MHDDVTIYDSNETLLAHETEAPNAQPIADVTPIPVAVIDAVTVTRVFPQHSSAYTLVLTATQPVQQICDLDPLRHQITLCAVDHDIVLCHSLQQAQDAANQATNIPNPNGFVITNAAGFPPFLRIESTGPLWVVGNSFPSRVSAFVERRTA